MITATLEITVVFSFFDKDVWCKDHAGNHDDNNRVDDYDDENYHDDDDGDDDDRDDYSSDGGNEKNFPLPPDWAAPRQSLPPSPSFQVDHCDDYYHYYDYHDHYNDYYDYDDIHDY